MAVRDEVDFARMFEGLGSTLVGLSMDLKMALADIREGAEVQDSLRIQRGLVALARACVVAEVVAGMISPASSGGSSRQGHRAPKDQKEETPQEPQSEPFELRRSMAGPISQEFTRPVPMVGPPNPPEDDDPEGETEELLGPATIPGEPDIPENPPVYVTMKTGVAGQAQKYKEKSAEE